MAPLSRLLPSSFARRVAGVALGCGAIVLATWILVSERVRYEETDAAADAQRMTAELALAFEQQTIREIQSIDQLVLFVRHEHVEEGAALDLRKVLSYSAIDPEVLRYVGVVDEHGRLRFSSNPQLGLDLSDREYFRFHAANGRDVLRIGRPTVARADGRTVIHFSRRISGPRGEFRGVALAGIAADYLAQGSRHFELGERGQLILLGEDGIARARRVGQTVHDAVDMNDSRLLARARQAGNGSFVSRGRVDGVPRFMSYRTLAGYPLVAAIGIPVDEALAEAASRKRLYYASAAAGTLATLLLAAALLVALWRQNLALVEQQRAEDRYRATFDQAPVGIAHHDAGGRFIRANRKFCSMLGYSEDELRGRAFADVLHPEDAVYAREKGREFYAGRGPSQLQVETRHVRKDGTVLLGAVTVARVAADDGSPYVVAMVEDVTDKRAAEAAQRESEARFRQVAENIHEVFWLADPASSQILYVSPAYERVWGRRCADLYAQPRQWTEAIHPEDRARVLEADRSKQGAGDYIEEYRIVRPDGSVRWIRDRAFPVLRDGRVYRFAGIAEDITDSRRAQDELLEAHERDRATFEQAAVGVTHTSLDGVFLSANPKLCDLLGYPQNELVGRRFVDITHPEDVAPSEGKRQDLLAAAPSAFVAPFEKRYLRKDGTTVWVIVSPGLVRNEAGEPQYFVTILQDITAQKRVQLALEESRAQFQQLAHHIPEAFWITDVRQREVVYASPAFEAIAGRAVTSLRLAWREWKRLIHPLDADGARAAYRAMEYAPVDYQHRIVRGDGKLRWVRARGFPVADGTGAIYRVAGTIEDITERKAAEEAIRQGEARYRATFDQAAIGVAHADLDGRLLRVNRKLAAMLGYAPEDLVGRTVTDITHADDRRATEEVHAHIAGHPEDTLVPEYEKRYLRKDGTTLWVSVAVSIVRDAQGIPEYTIGLVKDVSARRSAEEQVEYQAHYDALTELPNRTLFYDRLAQTLTQARRHDWTIGMLTIDLDRFSVVNDTLGHECGDRLLADIAKRLGQCVRSGDTLARIGGDEFGIIAAELSHAQDAGLVARKIIESLALPFEVGGQDVFITASIGIATFPFDGADGGTLMKNADAAMFRAKRVGRNNTQFYAAEMNERASDKLRLETDLRRALERDEFRLHFQPKARLRDGRIAGFEALLRWQRPGKGLVPPGDFVPLLEETGLIVPVGDWVIRAACAQLAAWRGAGFVPLPVAVNLSAKQFIHRDIAAVVDLALREHDVPAGLLELEITESDAMQRPEATMATLAKLDERGVSIAIDDFGTGYSSLSYLKRFPVDTLKLDRSFVRDLPDDADDVSIARAVVTLAHSLGLSVVAEGVETEAQRRFLAAEGCDQMQGYLLSRPVPAGECARLLEAAQPAAA